MTSYILNTVQVFARQLYTSEFFSHIVLQQTIIESVELALWMPAYLREFCNFLAEGEWFNHLWQCMLLRGYSVIAEGLSKQVFESFIQSGSRPVFMPIWAAQSQVLYASTKHLSKDLVNIKPSILS